MPRTQDQEATTARGHVLALDGIRGIAVLVVLGHSFEMLPAGSLHGIVRLVDIWLTMGWLGVQLFFVLSGFLITGILIDTREAKNYWSAFLARRALRIFPLYYGILVCVFVVAPLVGIIAPGVLHRADGAEHQIWYWTYLANWSGAFGRSVSVLPHAWSLCAEEQFYLLWPLLIRRLSLRSITILCLSLVGVAIASRLYVRTAISTQAAYEFTICRIDALVIGALGAVAVRTKAARDLLVAKRRPFAIGAAVTFGATFLATHGAARDTVAAHAFGYTLFAAVFAWGVVDMALARPTDLATRIVANGPLRSVGRYSYAMYLFHVPLHHAVGKHVAQALTGTTEHGLPFNIAYIVIATAITYGLAVLSFHLFEKRFLALKSHFEAQK